MAPIVCNNETNELQNYNLSTLYLQGSIVAVKNIQRRSINLTNDALKDLKAVST